MLPIEYIFNIYAIYLQIMQNITYLNPTMDLNLLKCVIILIIFIAVYLFLRLLGFTYNSIKPIENL